MAGLPRWLLRHTLVLERRSGVNARGPVYGSPVELAAFVLRQPRQVRSAEGREVVATVTAYLAPDVVVSPGDRITVDGTPVEVQQVTRHDGGGLPTPDHVEVAAG